MESAVTTRSPHCKRCGTCCLKGGPILHSEDKKILLSGSVGHQHLITIRKGELAYNPVKDNLEKVPRELIKVTGKRDAWTCFFYDEKGASCTIYNYRFLECRILKCWDPSELISIIGKDILSRTDLINPNDPILDIINMHEEECPLHEVNNLISALSSGRRKKGIMAKLTEFMRKDTAVRSHAKSDLGLKAQFELFIFGRPLSQILIDRGLSFITGQKTTLKNTKTH